MSVSAYVTHFVAKYDRAVVESFVAKLYSDGSALDSFHCSDSLSTATSWLLEACFARTAKGQAQRAFVMPIAPVLASWIREHPPDQRGSSTTLAEWAPPCVVS